MPEPRDSQSSTTESTDILAQSLAQSTSTSNQSLSKPSRSTGRSSTVRPPPATQTTTNQPTTRRQAAGDLEFRHASRHHGKSYAPGPHSHLRPGREQTPPPPPYSVAAATPSIFNTSGHSTTATSTMSPATLSPFQASSSSGSNNDGRSYNTARPPGSKNPNVSRSPPQVNRPSKNASPAYLNPQHLSTVATPSSEAPSVTDKAKDWLRRLSNSGISDTDSTPASQDVVPAPKVPTCVCITGLWSKVSKSDIENELNKNVAGLIRIELLDKDDSRNRSSAMKLITAYDEWKWAIASFESKEDAKEAEKHLEKKGIWCKYGGRRKVSAKVL